jgi:hypothetical protein
LGSLVRAWGAWGGWIGAGADRRFLSRQRGAPVAALAAGDFPGRWNPRRGLPEEIEPLPFAAAWALERAGCWRRGSGKLAFGGLIVAPDGGPLAAALAFARELAGGVANPPPSAFLQALPSTAASLLGILFGLAEYQATVVQGPLSAVQALRHGLDILELGRLERVLVASLSLIEGEQVEARGVPAPLRLAAALCIEPAAVGESDGAPVRIEVEMAAAEDRGHDRAPLAAAAAATGIAPEVLGKLAAAPLIELVERIDGLGREWPADIEQVDAARGERGRIRLTRASNTQGGEIAAWRTEAS